MESHRLDWISIEGFKSIAYSGKVELRPTHLVIGANGSGKSNFFDCLLDIMRQECHRFSQWITRLEKIGMPTL